MKPTKWLNAYSEQQTCLYTLPSLLTLCDLKNDKYSKLIVVDIPKDFKGRAKLKVYKGTGMVSEQGLPGIPSSVKSFYIDEPEPKIPIIAVSIYSSVLFYRNLKPYYKFTLPEMTIEPLEIDVWRRLPIEKPSNQQSLIENLASIDASILTVQSQKLLNLPVEERDEYIKKYADTPLQRLSVITAMTSLQRTSSDSNPPSCLVLTTEHGEILMIDTHSFGIIYQARICPYETTPSLITASGQFDTDFRIVIASREGALYLLRKSWLEGREIIRIDEPAIGLVLLPVDQTIVAAGMTNTLTCYSKKGKKLWSVDLVEAPICMTPVHLPHLAMTLIAVALKGGLVQLYSQRMVVDEFRLENTVQAMIFGHLGQEEHCLSLVLEDGSLLVKILKRTANFEAADVLSGSKTNLSDTSLTKNPKLDIPKKSSIFVEQTIREKENAKAMYGNFQVELWRLRLTAAKATVEAISTSESTISGDSKHAPIKLAAEICGVGPQFRLFLTIENMSTTKPATFLTVLLHADKNHYQLPKAVANLPTLIPGIPMKIDFEVNAVLDPIDHLPPSDLTVEKAIVRIFILKKGNTKPLIAAVVTMPESEAPLDM
ncbi:Bardet-Biedl syndrome 1 protein homolog [Condylostylus longicornis]|uniref:Bardet-Biedl syndrome 1 protein homolog n=1 Tax=Condylostylus longicornis TaxID=2530218 RepID=UPI00244DDA27|nr:Bardet-Biedl syndrome 1 protein homolog [Condylostylus longicornis]XP_055384124.1 Bardet-Biedl syndrome 1 protein homolog [Condylostylus longicornis]XP_055384125.1 Bardet-Biedl syndrome 1 protein homolog [Condylostylus longicornis]XP_055384127.1 Bardet-Biedl syndrome 1 protein homolog [Condylostylus longicornis]XP_055384128.1 Bardet-Biedl syndrome 1 protein homolog [Condylostylus longicornis]